VALVAGAPGLAGSAYAMGNTHLGPLESASLAWVFRPARSQAEIQEETFLSSAVSISRQIDRLGLPDGSIAVDTVGCGSLVVMNSTRPRQFIVTSDRDFEEVVADPVAFGVPYLLVPLGNSQGVSAINAAHPGIFAGGQVGDLLTSVAGQFETPGCGTFRLIQVLGDES